jgi:hypothetical protein
MSHHSSSTHNPTVHNRNYTMSAGYLQTIIVDWGVLERIMKSSVYQLHEHPLFGLVYVCASLLHRFWCFFMVYSYFMVSFGTIVAVLADALFARIWFTLRHQLDRRCTSRDRVLSKRNNITADENELISRLSQHHILQFIS